ncbi:hypothetical protein [Azotobacter salinestris]|uniref:hypothetical protein n=1 Tax=Azotobacter salinestris TaxID=69964 RepID=UPI0032DE834F
MLKKLCALFRRKEDPIQPKPERRPEGAAARSAGCMPHRSYSSGRPAPSGQPISENPMLNPLHPLNPANPLYDSDDDCRRRSHEPVSSSHCSSSSWSSSDSGSSSSSDSGSSSSSSSD